MKKLFDFIARKVWNEVGVELNEGIHTEESLSATYKVVSELVDEEFAEAYITSILEVKGVDGEKPEEPGEDKELDKEKLSMMTQLEKDKEKEDQQELDEAETNIQSVLNSKILNPDTGRQIKVSSGLSYDKNTGGYQAAKAKMQDSGISDDEIEKASQAGTGDSDSKSNSDTQNSKVQSQMKEEQASLEKDRDMGIAGAGGAVASQGESRYCNTMNTYDESNFKTENRDLIDSKKEEFKNSKLTAGNARDLRALGLDPDSDEAAEYIATREVFANKELERIKGIKGSVFYLKGKAGFAGNEEAYKEWARTAYDGTLATRKILKENTSLDTSKPHTTVQSTTELDNKTQSILEDKLKEAQASGDKDAVKHYEAEVKSFQKYRKYHDTYTIGEDKNGNMTIVSISNKKDSSLLDPQNNTTPANRFKTIKEQYGEDVAKTVVKSIDRGISEVSDVKKATINRTNDIEISDSYAKICDTPEMKKYMDKLKSNGGYLKYLDGKGLDVNKMSSKELLLEMQNHSRELIDNGKTPAYEPYGKITIKIGEFSQKGNFKAKYPKINFDDKSVLDCIDTKESEKDIVNASHKKVVDTIKNADAEDGYPKNGVNGPHTQGYISTVMDAMHFDSYIDGGDGKMILQMGIRGAQPEDIRGCLAEQTGFKGDASSPQGKADLKKHLREKCTIDAASGAIFVKDERGIRSIVEDTWRTAGTSQKVASGFGKNMRSCISKKVDTKRQK